LTRCAGGKSHRKPRRRAGSARSHNDSAASVTGNNERSSWSASSEPIPGSGLSRPGQRASSARRPDPNWCTARSLLYFAAVQGPRNLGSEIRFYDLDLLWSYGDSNPWPLACHQQAPRPPECIRAGHRPRASPRVCLGPRRLRYFRAVQSWAAPALSASWSRSRYRTLRNEEPHTSPHGHVC